MLGLFLFNLINAKYIFDSYKADKLSLKNWELNQTAPPHPSYFFIDIFSLFFFFFLVFLFLSKVSSALLNFAVHFSFLLPQ